MARILIVDDSAVQNRHLSELLVHAGHQTVIATTLPQARAAADNVHVDLSLVELLLMRSNGFEIAPVLAELTAAPVALMLSRAVEADRLWAQAQGITHLIRRPCSATRWRSIVTRLLGSSARSCNEG